MSKGQNIDMIWGAWHTESFLQLAFPSNWKIDVRPIKDSPGLSDDDLKKALWNTESSLSLRQMVKGKKKVAIAVEDLTRPTNLERLLKLILREILNSNIRKEDIIFIACNGAHAPMSRSEFEKKLGNHIVDNYLIINHNPYENLSTTNILLGQTPLKINRHFYEADLKICIGSIIPHSFAGFGAGAKLIIPGLSDIKTLERSHKIILFGFHGGVNDVEKNKFRLEIEEAVSRLQVDFFIGVVPNSKREIAGVFTGNVVNAHRAGVNFARKIYQTEINGVYDIVILNAYPKDTELLQANNAFIPLKSISQNLITEDGTFVLISKCSQGLGYHSLFGPGMRLGNKPIKKRFLSNKDLILFSPLINAAEFYSLYWKGYKIVNHWDAVMMILKKKYGDRCNVLILPSAPLQLLVART